MDIASPIVCFFEMVRLCRSKNSNTSINGTCHDTNDTYQIKQWFQQLDLGYSTLFSIGKSKEKQALEEEEENQRQQQKQKEREQAMKEEEAEEAEKNKNAAAQPTAEEKKLPSGRFKNMSDETKTT